ncbi:hypothetical protein [Thalassobius sp. I31.1]|uniref:hypothetical protein n=1 Tax=Thalassobius sp. I31.1 TaxID=2109912 RepID=UPI000D1AF427|nr:hypothetical protein [Thalassobius sp. I31.1]
MERLGPNRRAHLEHELQTTTEEVARHARDETAADFTWRKAIEISDSAPKDPSAAALESAAKEIVREKSLSSVPSKMLQGELEDELFSNAEEADDWYNRHQ